MVKDMKVILDGVDHFPGSIVQGKVIVSVEEPKPYNRIVVSLWGGAKVHWAESSHDGNRERTTHHYNSETFIHLQATVWKAEDSPTGNFPIGEHYFPFSFRLPQNDVLSSFEGTYGQIKYEVEAKIVQHGLFKFNRSVTAAFKVTGAPSGIDIQLCSKPIIMRKAKNVSCLCFISGFVSAKLNMPYRRFSPGETLPISVTVSNESSKPIRIRSILQRKETVTSSSGKRNILFRKVGSTSSSAPIEPGLITTFTEENLQIPAEAPWTLKNCSCISVDYILEVIVRIPWNCNISFKVPIIIAEPRESQPHHTPPAPLGSTSQSPFGLPAPQEAQSDLFGPQHPQTSLTTQDPPSYHQAIVDNF